MSIEMIELFVLIFRCLALVAVLAPIVYALIADVSLLAERRMQRFIECSAINVALQWSEPFSAAQLTLLFGVGITFALSVMELYKAWAAQPSRERCVVLKQEALQ